MSYEFDRCVEGRKLVRIRRNSQLVKAEIEGAVSDPERAGNDLSEADFKWAIIKGYYSMFRAAKAFLYSRGYREKSHYCLLVAPRELSGAVIEWRDVQNFEDAVALRQEADYQLKFTAGGAEEIIDNATQFIDAVKKVIGA